MKQGVWGDHDLSSLAWVRSTQKYRLSLDPLQGTGKVRIVLEERDEGVAYRCVIDESRCRELEPLMVEVPACFRPTVRNFLTNLKRAGARGAAVGSTRSGEAAARPEGAQLDAEEFVLGWARVHDYANASFCLDNEIDTSQLDAELDGDTDDSDTDDGGTDDGGTDDGGTDDGGTDDGATDDFFRFPFDAEPLRGLDDRRPAPVDVAFRNREGVSRPRHSRSSRGRQG